MKPLRALTAPIERVWSSAARGEVARRFPLRAVLASILFVLLGADGRADDWPGWRGRDGRGVWTRGDLPERFDETTVRRRWRQPIGSGYAGIAIAGGRLFTLDFVADGESIADENGAPRVQAHHPQRDLPPKPGEERVVCLDPATGKTLWSHAYRVDYGDLSYASGPRSTPTVVKESVFTIGAMGKVLALDVATGKVRWERDALEELEPKLPTWGFAASPVVHGDLVIAMLGARPAGTVVAFDFDTGRERWRALEDRPCYSTPILLPRKAG
ncbi:MAG TPA: PQQ-binding-like beta-propeller repeat protein, partial [Planctomycetota bacterium]|nr:PQQ-binding-like beta-propeller repeat protein [Planctomycetota bacterium]